MAWCTSREQNNIYVVCAEHPSSGMWYSTVADRFTIVLMKKEARFSFAYSSCPLFRCIPLSKDSTSSNHSSLRGCDPKYDLIWGLNQVIKTAGSCQKGCSLPPTAVPSCHLPFVGAAADVAAQLRQIQPLILLETNPSQRKDFCPARSVPWSDQSIVRWAFVPLSLRRGHTARILGEDRTASAYTGWWSLHSQALLGPKGLVIHFHMFPDLNFWENPISLQ